MKPIVRNMKTDKGDIEALMKECSDLSQDNNWDKSRIIDIVVLGDCCWKNYLKGNVLILDNHIEN